MKNKIFTPSILFYISFSILIIIAFQNCGEVSLAPKQPLVLESKSPVPHSMNMEICIGLADDDGQAYDFQPNSFPIVVNLNALPSLDQYLPDSDMDGLADEDETEPFSMDNSHSVSLIDNLCFQTGECPATCDDAVAAQVGLLRCDVLSFTNINGYSESFDADGDGAPDYLEIIRDSDPIKSLQQISPAEADSDQDGRNDLQEIRDQTDSAYPDGGARVTRYRPTITKIYQPTTDCPAGNNLYRISVPDQPFVQVGQFTDAAPYTLNGKTFSRSHEKDENVIMVYIPLAQIADPQIKRGLFGLFKIKDARYSPEPDITEFYQLTLENLEWTQAWEN